jgi:hypothetical protein
VPSMHATHELTRDGRRAEQSLRWFECGLELGGERITQALGVTSLHAVVARLKTGSLGTQIVLALR